MTSAYEVAKDALKKWRANYGNESLDMQCQRYAGYYCVWAGRKTERGMVTYPSANAAYQASKIVSKDPSKAPPGAMHWFDVTKWGHVGFALGNGLMAHTSAAGDTVEKLTNHVKISTVKSYYPKQYLGWSNANGKNESLVGKLDDGSKMKPDERKIAVGAANARTMPNTNSGIPFIAAKGKIYKVHRWDTGASVSGNPVWFLVDAPNGGLAWIWSGNFTDKSVDGIPSPPPPVVVEPDPEPVPSPVEPEPEPEPEPEVPVEPEPEPEEPMPTKPPAVLPEVPNLGNIITNGLARRIIYGAYIGAVVVVGAIEQFQTGPNPEWLDGAMRVLAYLGAPVGGLALLNAPTTRQAQIAAAKILTESKEQ